ncbi:hypothetical protein ABFS83_01G059500 [Erythranthe nasuta]
MRTLPSHYLTGLSEEHCWMLVQERAFGQEKEEYPNLKAIGKQIANKCAGVPLAAKALGGLLRFKRTEKEWNYVKDSEIWELPQDETSILPALRLSYHHLPLTLRQCFAYFAVFPKDSFIPKDELIFMWMAHGYISSRGALGEEDVGNDICNELLLRSLLQLAQNPVTKRLYFLMHDLLHDLAQSIMENKIPGAQAQRTNVRSASHSKIRQVNLRKKLVAFPTGNQSEMDMSFILKNFFRLRLLDASWTGINELSSAIGNLKHLRHLNLSGTEIRSLPDSLCSLWNLHALNLDDCRKLEVLPKKTRYLVNLRHLFLENCNALREMPSKIGELTRLQTLSLFVVGRDKGQGLEELQWLKLGGNLKIHHLDKVKDPVDAKKANLGKKENLRCLFLNWGSNAEYLVRSLEEGIEMDEKLLEALEPHPNLETLRIRGFKGRCFPVWMSNSTLDKLVEINLLSCHNCLHLPQLGELPHLKKLILTYMEDLEYILEEAAVVRSGNSLLSPSQRLPSLETLHLRSLPKIKVLIKEQVMVRSTEAFPNLEELYVEDCSSLILPPLSTSFKKLKILNCGILLLASVPKADLLNLIELSVGFEENTVGMCTLTLETLQSLTNLKSLGMYKAAGELSLPEQGLQHLTALEELYVFKCSQLVELPEEIKHIPRLKKVSLQNLPKMECLPKALQNLSSSLHRLELDNLHHLSSLPDWFGDLTSLEQMYIEECPKLASFPTSIRRMTNLRYLTVKKCPELERRCERANGEDWHKIQHVRHLLIGE